MNTKAQSNINAVLAALEANSDVWLSSNLLFQEVGTVSLQNVYASVSELAKKGVIEKRPLTLGTGFEYKLAQGSRHAQTTAARRAQRAILLDTNTGGTAASVHSDSNHEPLQEPSSNLVEPPVTSLEEKTPARDEPATNNVSQSSAETVFSNVKVIPEGVSGKLPRIQWTAVERNLIANKVVEIQEKQPHISSVNAVRLAQVILPENRRRLTQITNKHHVAWIDAKIDAIKAEKQAGQQRALQELADAARLESDNKDTVSHVATAEDSQQTVTRQIASTTSNFSLTAEATIGACIDLLLHNLGRSIKQTLIGMLTSVELKEVLTNAARILQSPNSPPMEVHQAVVNVEQKPLEQAPLSSLQNTGKFIQGTEKHKLHNPQPFTSETEKLKRILVLGLLPAQVQEVANEFKDALDIRFWRTDQSPNLLKNLCRQVDQTIVMTDFVGHAHEGLIKNANVPFIRQPGGMTKLKDTLTTIYAES